MNAVHTATELTLPVKSHVNLISFEKSNKLTIPLDL